MDMKKIIREEVGDFDWIKDEDPVSHLLTLMYKIDEIGELLYNNSDEWSYSDLTYDLNEGENFIKISYQWGTQNGGGYEKMKLYYEEIPMRMEIEKYDKWDSESPGTILLSRKFKTIDAVTTYIDRRFGLEFNNF